MTFEETYQKYLDDSDPSYDVASLKDIFKWFYDSAFHWEKATDIKPKSGKIVLICCVTEQLRRPIILRAVWYDRFTEVVSDDEYEAGEYCEEKDEYFLREGWYEFNQYDDVHWAVSEEVTHWAKIPLPPVE